MIDARQEAQWARDCLARAARTVDSGQWIEHYLGGAFTHAVRAWCLAHLRGKGVGDNDNHLAFMEKAPEVLRVEAARARGALHGLARGTIAPTDAVVAVKAAVGVLLEVAAQPPKNRRRFPARYRAGRPLRKPRVKPGGWIDTGRYRPARVISMMDEAPHIMTLSYGDEVDRDFRPHTVDWKTVRVRGRPPSLKDVFAPGDWVRDARFGYGRLLAVRNSTMAAAFRYRQETLVPDATLRKIEKVDGPEPEDERPLGERFPPGAWIEQDCIGSGVVVETGNDALTVLLSSRIVTLSAGINDPVIWKLDRPPLDLTQPHQRRRIWWWRHEAQRRGRRPCPCCGYPNLGAANEFGLEPVQCILCGWTDEWDGEDDADEVRPGPDPEDPPDWEWPNRGYSLTEARRNFEERGVMFWPGDPREKPFAAMSSSQRRMKQLLDSIMDGAPEQCRSAWTEIAELRRLIVEGFPPA